MAITVTVTELERRRILSALLSTKNRVVKDEDASKVSRLTESYDRIIDKFRLDD